MAKAGDKMKNRDKNKIAKIGWMPFWWGNKFNKRLASKRARHLLKEKERDEKV